MSVKTKKIYENEPYIKEFNATVLSCECKDGAYCAVLDQTAFFPEGGGQYSDTGSIAQAKVLDVQIYDGVVCHKVDMPLTAGETVLCKINWSVRFSRMQNHTGEHIVSGTIHSLFGYSNVGFHLNDRMVTLDIDGTFTAADIELIEREANKAVFANKRVICHYPTAQELDSFEYRSKLDITENVRIVEIEGVDMCACCAPHVASTGEIGLIKILDFYPHKRGTRIEMICGLLALEDYKALHNSNKAVMGMLSATRDGIAEAVEREHEALSAVRTENKALSAELAYIKAEKYEIGNMLCAFADFVSYDELRYCSNNFIKEDIDYCCVFSKTENDGFIYVISSAQNDIRDTVKALNSAFGGKGGGKNNYAQGKITAEKENIIEYFKQLNG